MARNYYSSEDVCVEALFEETNNVCICSRAHLKDYYVSKDYNINPLDDECGVCYEEVPEDYCEDTSDSHNQALKDSSEDPEMPYDDVLGEELELMKSMGLPTSFGKKCVESNYGGFYSAYDCDSYEECEDETELSNYFEESDQNGECLKISKSDNEELYNCESSDDSKIKYDENNKSILENCKTDVNRLSKLYNENASEFENFWTLHGDTICLNSWIKKFKDYISPEFLEGYQQSDHFQKIINSDIWSSDKNQTVIQHDPLPHIGGEPNCESPQALCADDVALISSSDNCDSALKNMNDKFESMSFSDEMENKLDNESNITHESENCICENAESREMGVDLDSYELYSLNMLPYTTADFEKCEVQLDLLENAVNDIDFLSGDNLSSMYEPENNVSSTGLDINSNELDYLSSENRSIVPDLRNDPDFKLLSMHYPEIFQKKQTQNPLFICTKSDEEYEAEIVSPTWEEMWFAHCQGEFDKHSKLFSDNPTKLSKYSEGELLKCKYCGEINCLVCNSDSKNGDNSDNIKVSDVFTELISNSHSKSNLSFPNEILAFPVTYNRESKDTSLTDEVPLSVNKLDGPSELKKEDSNDDEPPVELPIKRLHEVESENEEPEDMIKELGLVIRPTKSLRIKKKKRCRVRKSHKNHLKTHFQIDDANEDSEEPKESEKNGDNIESNEENHSEIAEAAESMKFKAEEVNPVENLKCDGLALIENPENVDEMNHASQNIDSCKNENVLKKYWHQRYRLFHKFDEGIKLDEESWFSVTPERIARHIAERCACGVMIDAFCGAGGNTIQFASLCYHVIAIDKDPQKIELAKHNATVYGVADYIDFIVGDYLDLAPYLKADGVFLSPPWGGPSYVNDTEYTIDKIEPDINKIFEVSRKITQNIAFFVPKNTVINQLVQLSGEGNSVEIEQNFLNKKVKTITAYYGEFVNQTSAKKDEPS